MNIERVEEFKAKAEEELTFEEVQELIYVLEDFLEENGHKRK